MPLVQADDKVWFNSDTKLREIYNEVCTNAAAENCVLVLSHFPFALTELTRLFRDANVQHRSFSSYDSPGLCTAPAGTIWMGLARAFHSPSLARVSSDASPALQIMIVEHHPRRSKDQTLLDAAAKLSCQVELCFHFSLDDPLLLHFNGDSIQTLFKKMGIDEGECLSHHLITTAIRTAQDKIESQVTRDLDAESIEDWFRYNLPEKK